MSPKVAKAVCLDLVCKSAICVAICGTVVNLVISCLSFMLLIVQVGASSSEGRVWGWTSSFRLGV